MLFGSLQLESRKSKQSSSGVRTRLFGFPVMLMVILVSGLGPIALVPATLAQEAIESEGNADPSAADPVPSAPELPIELPSELPASPGEGGAAEVPYAEPSAPLQVESADVFIDRTDYNLGATQRELPSDGTGISGSGAIDTISGSVSSGSSSHSYSAAMPLTIGGQTWDPSSIVIPSSKQASRPYFSKTLLRPLPLGRMGNGNVELLFPLAIPASISSVFGWRVHPIFGTQRMHTGTDIAAPMGTPVLAALAGRVLLSDFLGGYGLTVALEHNDGTQQTMYAHLSEVFVKPGELIQQGTAIGRVGSTGNSTGPHLHFEFRQLTDQGWMAIDAGQQLEFAMAELVKSLQIAQKPTTVSQANPLPPTQALKSMRPPIAQ
jgi:murein DD-endopeptidase MepM/ murein hydrolase activator NlpD